MNLKILKRFGIIGALSGTLCLIALYLLLPQILRRPPTEFPANFISDDGGFLSGEPCGPPCFWNIIPGKTTRIEAERVLTEKGIFDKCVGFDNYDNKGHFCHPSLTIIHNDQDIIVEILFLPEEEITVGEVISLYGYPDAVQLGVTLDHHDLTYESHLVLYYDHLGMTINLDMQKLDHYHLTETTQVNGIGYLDHMAYQEIQEIRAGFLTEWKGYGIYE